MLIDFGDAPDTYGTLVSGDGPRHSITGYDAVNNTATYMLGASIDPEDNGQPGPGSDGDGADDDGVLFNSAHAATPVVLVGTDPATSAPFENELSVEASEDGFVSAWVDWDENGDFTGADEKVIDREDVVAGTNTLTFSGATTFAGSEVQVRVRYSTDEDALEFPTGPAWDGEVEDYLVSTDVTTPPAGTPIFFGCANPVTFDAGPENWRNISTSTGFDVFTDHGTAGWDPVAGNPGGAILENDGDGQWQELRTPELAANGYATDYSFALGDSVQFDYRNNTGIGYDIYAAVQGTNGDRFFYIFRPQILDSTQWNQVVIPFDADLWLDGFNTATGPSGSAPSAADFAAVMADVDHFAFSIEGQLGADETLFDNFGGSCVDFGVAPDGYSTLLASNGARHSILDYVEASDDSTLMLGTAVDRDLDAQVAPAADTAEDGVGAPITVGATPTVVSVTATNDTGSAATLAGWIDLDGSGIFDAGELETIAVGAGTASYDLTFDPATTAGSTWARFRLLPGTVAAPSPTGLVAGGEVEDYEVSAAVSTLPIFACSPGAYLFQNAPTDAYGVNLVTGAFSNIAPAFNAAPAGSGGNINGIGYNVQDDYIYGWDLALQEIVRVGSNFSVQSLGVPTGFTAGGSSVIGDVDENGQYWFIGSDNNWYQVDLMPGSATYMQVVDQGPSTGVTGLAGNDWAYVPAGDALYRITTDGASGEGLLWEFDRASGTWSGGASVGVDIAQVGAAYADNDYLYVSVNATGAIYRIDVLTGVGEHFASGPNASANDGTRCFEARTDIDLGDAPNSYGTVVAADGARHSIPGYDDAANTATYMLGTSIDSEANGQPSPDADGDDTVDADNVDDEDGVEFNPALGYASPVIVTGLDPSGAPVANELAVEVSEDGFVSVWVDWDLDGTFTGAGEQVVDQAAVTSGANTLNFSQLANPPASSTYVRVRFSSDVAAVDSPTGSAPDGEVEDYRVLVQRTIEPATCVNTSATFYAFTFGAPVEYTGTGGVGTVARFANVAVIDGVAVDLLAEVTAGTLSGAGEFRPDGDDVIWNINGSATVRFTFVLAGTTTPTPINGVFIANDMDGGESATFSAADLLDYGVTPGSAVSVLPGGGNVVFSGSGNNNADPPSRFQVVMENIEMVDVAWQGGSNSGFLFDGDQDLAVPIACDPEVEVTKTSSDPDALSPSGTVDYTVTVTNTGDIDASGTVVTDELADGIASATWTCTAAGGAVCPNPSGVITDVSPLNETIAVLPVGGSVEYVITATLEATLPPVVVQTVSVDPPGSGTCAPDGGPEPCTATVTNPPVPVVSITKTTATVGAAPGELITYMITARNVGAVSADGTQVSDPGGTGLDGVAWTCVADGGAACPSGASGVGGFDETLATFPVGSSVAWTVTGTVSNDPPATIANTATMTPPDPTPGVPGDDPLCLGGTAPPCTSTVNVPITISPALEVVKDADVDSMSDLGSRDREIEYTFTVENTGDVVLFNVTVDDPLSGLSPIECTPGTGPDIGTMLPGDIATCTATFEVDSAAYRGGVTNVATVDGETSGGDPVTDDGTSTVPGRPFPPDTPDIPGTDPDPDPTPTATPTPTPTVTPTPDPTDTPTPSPTPDDGDEDDGDGEDGGGSDGGGSDGGGTAGGGGDESRDTGQGPLTPAETGYGVSEGNGMGSLLLSGLAALVVALGTAALRRIARPVE